MSTFALPDSIFREEELIDGLPALAEAQGRGAAAFDMPPPEEPFPLSEIHDDDIDKAAMDAYRKDFVNFGFAPWEG